MNFSSGDYYRRLRVPRTASPKEIKVAFRRLARQYHPDLHPNQPDAAAKFQALREAYEVLSDRIRRQNYDERATQTDDFSDSFFDSGESYRRTRDPQTPTDFYIRGIRQALAHRYSAALADYSRAIALDATFAEAYLRRAEVRYLLDNDSGVLADCQQAIALDPSEPKPYYYQGLARYRLGYVQSATAAFSNAITRDPEDARYYNWRAIAAQDLGDIDEAAQDFRRSAQLYRAQGDLANCRDIQQTLTSLGTAGRPFPYQLLGAVLKGLRWPFSKLLGSSTPSGSKRSRRAGKPSPDSTSRPSRPSPPASPPAANPFAPRNGKIPSKKDRSATQSRKSSASPSPFHRSPKKRVSWAPGVSSRPTEPRNVYARPMSGVITSLRLLSNPAGEMLPIYERLPRGKKGLVGYGLAVLANLCFVFGATQYFTNSSWLLASCLWASGGLTFVAMVLVLSVVRVWMRIQGLWTADIFMLGTTMVPLGLLTIAAGLIPVLTQSLAAPWNQTATVTGLLMVVFWAFSHAVIALHNGLHHIHHFSVQTSAWLSPLILGLGIGAGIGTWHFLSTSLFSITIATPIP